MSNGLVIILVVVIGIGGLIGGAYLLDRRAKKRDPIGTKLPGPGPLGRILLWIGRILVVLMVLSIIGAFVFKSLFLAWITVGCLTLYIIVGIIYRTILAVGK